MNRTFHVLKTPVYQFELHGRYQTLFTDDDKCFWYYLEVVYKPKYQIWCESVRSMYSRQQFTDLIYMGGTRPCGPMTIIFVVLFRVSIQA